MKIRMHRGSLADSMATAQDIEPTAKAVGEYLWSQYSKEGATALVLTTLSVWEYGQDPRTGWDTHIVLMDGKPVAFTDGIIVQ